MLYKQQLLGAVTGAVTVAALGAGALAFAQTNTSTSAPSAGTVPKQGVAGTVTAVSSNTITITGKDGKTYTIDAGSATITKDETVSVGDVAVGDTLMAHGSVSGTTVTATNIHDGKLPQDGPGMGRGFGPGPGPGIRGTVSSMSGTTLTVTATTPKTNTTSTYTVDAANAQVLVGGQGKPTQGSLSSVKTGDTVMVAGAVNGSNVTAKVVIDGPWQKRGPKPGSSANAPSTTTQ
jgi:hypothetical protein